MILRPMAGGLHRIEIFVEGEVIGVKKVARMGRCERFLAACFINETFSQGKKKQPDQAAFMKRCLILCSLKQGRRGLTRR